MRVLIKSHGCYSIFYDKMFGYKRYYVSWRNGTLETYSGLLIKLPRENIKETFNLVLEILNNDNFDKINIIDARQEGQVVING